MKIIRPFSVDFASAFTRASDATYFDKDGALQTATTDEPRWGYDPDTGDFLGLIVEGAATNILLNSATLSTQSVTVSAQEYTLSFYGTGTVTLSGASTAGPLVGTGANQRVSLTFTPSAGSLTCTVSGTVEYAQLEAGDTATSYITTTGTAETRAADDKSGGDTFIDVAITETEWSAGTYSTGTRRYVGTDLYEVVADPSTSDAPVAGAAADPPTWILVGKINKWKAFDNIINDQIENSETLRLTVCPDGLANSVALFELEAATAIVVVKDAIEGEVYRAEKNLVDNSLITNWYQWFFEPISRKPDAVFLDLPPYVGPCISIEVDNGTDTAKIGECVIGLQADIGVTNYNTSVGIVDYSRKDVDTFGNARLTQRAFSKRAEYDVTVRTDAIAGVNRELTSIRAQPIVFIGDENRAETVVFGYYRDYNIILSTPSISEAVIEVEGLV